VQMELRVGLGGFFSLTGFGRLVIEPGSAYSLLSLMWALLWLLCSALKDGNGLGKTKNGKVSNTLTAFKRMVLLGCWGFWPRLYWCILAAIAIPAYQDYVERAQQAEFNQN